MKKILLLSVILAFLPFIKVFAITCSLQVTQNNTSFQNIEIETSFLNIAGPIFAASKFFILEPKQPVNRDCNIKVFTSNYIGFLSVRLNYGATELFGGSMQLNYGGLQESLVLAFYNHKAFQSKICELFGNSYNLNCRLYQK